MANQTWADEMGLTWGLKQLNYTPIEQAPTLTTSANEIDTNDSSSKFGNFLKNNSQKIGQGADLANTAFTALRKKPMSEAESFSNQMFDTVSDALPPQFQMWAKLAGAANSGLNLLLGDKLANTTTADAFLSSPFGLGLGQINSLLGSNANTITKNEQAFATLGNAWSGSNSQIDNALKYSGARFGAISKRQLNNANGELAEASRQNLAATQAADEANTRYNLQQGMSSIVGNRRMFESAGGFNPFVSKGKEGMIIAKRVASQYKMQKKKSDIFKKLQGGILDSSSNIFEIELLPEEFKEGGTITSIKEIELFEEEFPDKFKEGGSFNVIPDGALHARLHHMENADNLTKKGIPVVSEKEGGELEQQAEIEKEEIILRLSLTKRLEELAKENTDESAIEAGKILVEEILNNTIDNTGILNN